MAVHNTILIVKRPEGTYAPGARRQPGGRQQEVADRKVKSSLGKYKFHQAKNFCLLYKFQNIL